MSLSGFSAGSQQKFPLIGGYDDRDSTVDPTAKTLADAVGLPIDAIAEHDSEVPINITETDFPSPADPLHVVRKFENAGEQGVQACHHAVVLRVCDGLPTTHGFLQRRNFPAADPAENSTPPEQSPTVCLISPELP